MSPAVDNSLDASGVTLAASGKWWSSLIAMLLCGAVIVELAFLSPHVESKIPWAVHAVAVGLVILAAAVLIAGPLRIARWARVVTLILVIVAPIQTSVLIALTTGAASLPFFYTWPLLAAAAMFSRKGLLVALAYALGLFAVAMSFATSPFDLVNFAAFSGGIVGVVLSARSLTESADHLFAELKRLAEFDALTGLRNRRAFDRLAAESWGKHADERRIAVVIDLDNFKVLNDRHGHAAGDLALQRAASCLGQAFDSHLVARIGGEEFAVLCKPGTELKTATALAEQFNEQLKVSHGVPGASVSASCGVAQQAPGTRSFEDLLRAADDNTYAAKRGGRDRVVSSAGLYVA